MARSKHDNKQAVAASFCYLAQRINRKKMHPFDILHVKGYSEPGFVTVLSLLAVVYDILQKKNQLELLLRICSSIF